MAKNFDVQSTDDEIVQNYYCAAKSSRNKEMSREHYMIELNRLGKTDLEVARLGFGAARIGESKSKTVVKSLLNSLRDVGITFIDTADCYAESEELIGTLLGSDINDFVVATKCGCITNESEGQAFSRSVILDGIDRSLKRLGVERLDLVFLHSCSSAVLQAGEAIEALLYARDVGKVRYTGYSGDNDDAQVAISIGVFDVLQVTFNILNQRAINEVLPAAVEAEMGVVAKRPIANARLLSSDFLRLQENPYWKTVEKLLIDEGISDNPLSYSLLFTLSHPEINSAIVGTTNTVHARDNAKRVQFGQLSSELMVALHDLGRHVV